MDSESERELAAVAAAADTVAPLPLFQPAPATLVPCPPFVFHSTHRTHPTNKNNYRYTPCGPSPSTSSATHPAAQAHRFIESVPQRVRFSWEDRSQFLLSTDDATTITCDKGWRAARSNVPLRQGTWYWEIVAERAGGHGGREHGGVGEGSWCRIGVARREAPLNAPAGFCGHSYAYRDRHGDAVTLSRPVPFADGFSSGDVIGVLLTLPATRSPDPADRKDPARIVRKRVPIRYKGQLYFESLEYLASKEMDDLASDPALREKQQLLSAETDKKKAAAPGTKPRPSLDASTPPARALPRLEDSRVAFFKNGVPLGVAFENLFEYLPLRPHPGQKSAVVDIRENWHDDGMTGYFPFVSVFNSAVCTLNPGPSFSFPPPTTAQALEEALKASPNPPKRSKRLPSPLAEPRPLCERYVEFLAEQAALDDADEVALIKKALLNPPSPSAVDVPVPSTTATNGQPPSKKLKTNSGSSTPVHSSSINASSVKAEATIKKEEDQAEQKPSFVSNSAIGSPEEVRTPSPGANVVTATGMGGIAGGGSALKVELGMGLLERDASEVPESEAEDDVVMKMQ